MAHSVKILLDSITQYEHRLTTFEIVMPRIILAEWNTHRMFTRSSASSRAIPVAKMIDRVMTDPYIPMSWGKNQKGMSAVEDILGDEALRCTSNWLYARDEAVKIATSLMDIGVHKQTANRLLEPFMWHTVINTATEYSNFLALRDDKNAHPDIQLVAHAMKEVMATSSPTLKKTGEWHAPYAQEGEEFGGKMKEVTSGRCARVSYLTHDGKADPAADIALHDRLLPVGHMAPLEHAARPMIYHEYHGLFSTQQVVWSEEHGEFRQVQKADGTYAYNHFCGNLQGWVQYRKHIAYEHDFGELKRINNIT